MRRSPLVKAMAKGDAKGFFKILDKSATILLFNKDADININH